MTTVLEQRKELANYLYHHNESMTDIIGVVANTLIQVGVEAMALDEIQLDEFNSDPLGYLKLYRSAHGETLAHATVAQGLTMLVWLDKRGNK